MVVNDRPLKRARRNRVTADLHAFPGGESGGLPFREGVRAFLDRHAHLPSSPSSLFPSLLTRQVPLRSGEAVVALDVVEEDVTRSARSVHCNQCRVVGWSGHPVCRKRYHFIIRADGGGPADGYQKSCYKCGNPLQLLDPRCRWCETTEDAEEWVYSQLDHNNTHLLHGLVHSNGFGHLLRLNGKEGGSKFLSGHDIMDFWDRLCNFLSVRKVSVMDVSRKYGTEYRLLHGITKGCSWYGEWGYEFGNGSYALTLDAYRKSVDTLSSVALAPFLFWRRRQRTPLQETIAFYQSLSGSELTNLRELLSFVLKLIRGSIRPKLAAGETPECIDHDDVNVLYGWTRNDIESTQNSLVKILVAASKGTWILRRSLKGVLWNTASPELLDYCLKYLGGKSAAGGMVVQTRHNPDCHDREFRLIPDTFLHHEDSNAKYPSKEHLRQDLRFLFDSLLNPATIVKFGPQPSRETIIDSATKLLDCKQFVKDFEIDKKLRNSSLAIHLSCHVVLSDQGRDEPAIPPEEIVLPLNATIADLKNEAARAFRDVYAMFTRFEVEKLLEYGPVEDSVTVKFLVGGSGSVKFLVGGSGSVKIKGTGSSKHALNEYRMERGTEKWIVDCKCGAVDDDGERMMACDSCGVWHHTRCAGIDNSDEIPNKFVCMKCIIKFNKKFDENSDMKEEPDTSSLSSSNSTCRVEAHGTHILRVRTSVQ